MKREIVFEKEECGHTALTDVISGERYILRSFRGRNERTGETLFRLDRRGVSYFLRQYGHGESLYTVYDIIVYDDTGALDLFSAFDDKPQGDSSLWMMLPFCQSIAIDIAGNGRTYPSVEYLAIGDRVVDIKAKNSQFPSVSKIGKPERHGVFFASLDACLFKRTPGTQYYTLINVFGLQITKKHPGFQSYFMNHTKEIADYALACSSIHLLADFNGNPSIKLNKHSFDGCLDAVYDKNGMLTTDRTIIDVALGASSVEIGNGKYMYINTALLGDKVKRVIIDTYLFPNDEYNFASKTANLVSNFSDKAEFVLNITNPLARVPQNVFMTMRKCSFSKIVVSYDGYVMKDDVVYTKNKKTLVCAWNKAGSVSVPEGVRSIATAAFIKSPVSSVSLPKSLREIGSCAFLETENLQSITLPEGLLRIDDSAFEGSGIREISIPKSCESIGQSALDCADLIKAYPGSKISITSAFRARESEDIVVVENAKTGRRYAFVDGSILTGVFEGYRAWDLWKLIDDSWRDRNLDAFECEVSELYSHVGREYLNLKIHLAVFAFINGYALEKAQTYAKSHAFDFVLRCLENGDEKLAIEAIKADGLLTRPALKKLLPAASSAGMVEAAAVISELLQPKAEKTARAISL